VKRYALRYMESKGSFEYSKGVIGELRGKTEGLVGGIEESLGPEGTEGAEALRAMLRRLVLK
jgi:geranylgeranyl diphosphate synthase type 3